MKLSQMSISKQGNNFYLRTPLTSILQLDLAVSNMKKGGFKLVAFCTLMPSTFNSKTEGAAICTKHTYNSIERVVEIDRLLTKKTMDIPHEAEKEFLL